MSVFAKNKPNLCAGVPKNWVHIVFQDYAPGCGFTAGEPSATDALTLLMRSGANERLR
jgi:hypothetical protein